MIGAVRGMGTLSMDDHDPSDSTVQREIELVMLQRLADQHPDWKLADWKAIALELGLPSLWQKAKPDAVWKTDAGEVVIAECYARISKLKAGQHRKLAMDALKLLALKHAIPIGGRVQYLLVVPEELAGAFEGGGWFPVAIRLAAAIVPVCLLDSEREKLGDAAQRQAQGQSRITKPTRDKRL